MPSEGERNTRHGASRGALLRLPYEITCPRCNARVMVVHEEWTLLMGPRPVELSTSLDGRVLATCHACSTLVPINDGLVLLL